jgi:hypothetical protein
MEKNCCITLRRDMVEFTLANGWIYQLGITEKKINVELHKNGKPNGHNMHINWRSLISIKHLSWGFTLHHHSSIRLFTHFKSLYPHLGQSRTDGVSVLSGYKYVRYPEEMVRTVNHRGKMCVTAVENRSCLYSFTVVRKSQRLRPRV